mmetsp:Transcript_60799/g.131912  ORF Transcript_60799/g.131912 Transcript_60799/m.131912 type:complete len:595 (-) Transcript_60799:76-1860(-)
MVAFAACALLGFSLFSLLWSRALAAVLSSSKLEACLNDGSEELDCEMKMVLLITLEHGQDETESAEFLVRDAQQDETKRQLLKPWQVKWRKSSASWRYPLRYVQDVNNKPTERILTVSSMGCSDNPSSNAEDLTCGVAMKGNQRVPDSEGFCCGCDLNDMTSGGPTRGNLDCWSFSESAHCLGFDPLWYSVFEVDPPQIFYDIVVTVAMPEEPGAGWHNVTYRQTRLVLSHQQPVAEAEGGALRVQLVGDLATATAPHSFASRYLVVPSYPAGHPRVNVERPLENAMLVDRSAFDLSGLECNKVGVSYTAFKRQREKCESPAGSCLDSQLDDLHAADVARLERGLSPRSLVSGFCGGAVEFSSQRTSGVTTRMLACPLEQRHTTFLRLEASADEAMFFTNVASGEIVDATVPPFQALQGAGGLDITVVSTGRVLAQFMVGVSNCSEAFEASPAVSLSLEPYETEELHIKLYASQTAGGRFQCTANLFNSIGTVVDSRVVHFNVSDLKITNGVQVPVDNNLEGDDVGTRRDGGDCSDLCPSMFSVLCFIAHGCGQKLAVLFAFLLLIPLTICGCFRAAKGGLLCKLSRCLCGSRA